MDPEIRWKQRLAHYRKAYGRLAAAVSLANERPLTELEQQGLIQAFEFTHELAWNLMKDWFAFQGTSDITGSRDAIREAFASGIVDDGEAWMGTIRSRNESSHTYNQEIAEALCVRIVDEYEGLFRAFLERMTVMETAPA